MMNPFDVRICDRLNGGNHDVAREINDGTVLARHSILRGIRLHPDGVGLFHSQTTRQGEGHSCAHEAVALSRHA